MAGRRIGLLGGSFNPAHEGHRQISLDALARLRLDQVWWLVSPQNPLKSSRDMKPFAARMTQAKAMAAHPRIKISDFEQRHGLRFTVDSLRLLLRQNSGDRFVWLMGADNLSQIPRWRRWQEIFRYLPVAVFDRPGYTYKALSGLAARRFADARCKSPQALARRTPPAWCFLFGRRNSISATALRQRSD